MAKQWPPRRLILNDLNTFDDFLSRWHSIVMTTFQSHSRCDLRIYSHSIFQSTKCSLFKLYSGLEFISNKIIFSKSIELKIDQILSCVAVNWFTKKFIMRFIKIVNERGIYIIN